MTQRLSTALQANTYVQHIESGVTLLITQRRVYQSGAFRSYLAIDYRDGMPKEIWPHTLREYREL